MLVSKQAKVTWHRGNKKYYENKGYVFTEYGNVFLVNISDLTKGSSALISAQCDYCKTSYERRYIAHIKGREKVNKDCCANKECLQKKKEDAYLNQHGVTHHMHREEVKEKIKQTNLVKYGVENPFQSEDIKEKIKVINMEKYGVDNPAKSEVIKEKIRESMFNNHGVYYSMQSEELRKKMFETKVKNGKTSYNKIFPVINGVCASKSQVELGNYLDGTINDYIEGKFVDIVLHEKNIAIEYDGKGHDLSVRLGQISSEDFHNKDMNDQKRIIDKGWKFVRIKNPKDKKFDYEEIKQTINIFSMNDERYLSIEIS